MVPAMSGTESRKPILAVNVYICLVVVHSGPLSHLPSDRFRFV